jgi:hypothetical protein
MGGRLGARKRGNTGVSGCASRSIYNTAARKKFSCAKLLAARTFFQFMRREALSTVRSAWVESDFVGTLDFPQYLGCNRTFATRAAPIANGAGDWQAKEARMSDPA